MYSLCFFVCVFMYIWNWLILVYQEPLDLVFGISYLFYLFFWLQAFGIFNNHASYVLIHFEQNKPKDKSLNYAFHELPFGLCSL